MLPLFLLLLTLGPERTLVEAPGGFSVARSSRTTMLAWSDGARVFVAPVARDWVTGTAAPLPTLMSWSTGVRSVSPSIASDGEGFLVAWLEPTTYDGTGYVTMRLDADGKPATVLPALLARQPGFPVPAPPRVWWAAGRYLVSYGNQLAALDARGTLLTLGTNEVAGSIGLDVAGSDEAMLMVAQRPVAGICSGFSPSFFRCSPTTYTLTAHHNRQGTIQSSGFGTTVVQTPRTFAVGGAPSGFLVAHSDLNLIATIPISREGRAGTPRWISASGPTLGLAGNRDRFLLVWFETNLRGVFLHADGTRDGEPFVIGNALMPPPTTILPIDGGFAIAWARGSTVVVRELGNHRRRP